jgi:hypothetical protein
MLTLHPKEKRPRIACETLCVVGLVSGPRMFELTVQCYGHELKPRSIRTGITILFNESFSSSTNRKVDIALGYIMCPPKIARITGSGYQNSQHIRDQRSKNGPKT